MRIRRSIRGANLHAGLLLACVPLLLAPLPPADDRPEPGMQGQVPLLSQLTGDAAAGYWKGLELVGGNTILDRGANFTMAWVDDCAYVTTVSAAQTFGLTNTPYLLPSDDPLNGMAVIDASDPTNPELVHIIQSPVLLRTHESLQGNDARKILVATSAFGNLLEVWDASDCRNPVLRSTLEIGTGFDLEIQQLLDSQVLIADYGIQFSGHALCISPDGTHAYAIGIATSSAAIDLTDLDDPRVIEIFTPSGHDCDVSFDGNRMYQAPFSGAVFGTQGVGFSLLTGILWDIAELFGNLTGSGIISDALEQFTADTNFVGEEGSLGSGGSNGLLVVDVSEIAAGDPDPEMHLVGRMEWTAEEENQHPASGSHTLRQFRQGDRTYLYSSDEWPISGEFGSCPWAHARILDITDETNPVKVSDIALDVSDPDACLVTTLDAVNYSTHYVGIDDPHDATTLFISWYGAGVRVWDIHDVTNPVEIAYYHPAPLAETAPTRSSHGFGSSSRATYDVVPTYVRYRPETGHIWFASDTRGFQILRLTDSAGPTAPLPLPEPGRVASLVTGMIAVGALSRRRRH